MLKIAWMLMVICMLLPSLAFCQKLKIRVSASNVQELESAIRQAQQGSIIQLRGGVYRLDGRILSFTVPGITIRSASGNRESVILDGEGTSPSIFEVSASNVTIADLTIKSPYNHAIHIFTPRSGGDINNVYIRNVHIIDPGQQAIKINPTTEGASLSDGVIEHSLIELTDAGRRKVRNNCYTGGIDAHHAMGWLVRDNEIRGFWCPQGLAEHAIHFWKDSRGTVVERNTLVDNARGVGFGMQPQKGSVETNGCPPESDHREGIIRKNLIIAAVPSLFASQSGADCGICLWYACNVRVEGNQIYSEQPARTFSSIEWRFPSTQAEVKSNVTNVRMLGRDGASATTSDNRTDAEPFSINSSADDLPPSQMNDDR